MLKFSSIFTLSLTSIIFVAGFLYSPKFVAAATITWDGGGGTNNWSEDANWSGDVEP